MYIVHNAFHNTLRNKGRNILIGTIMLIVIVATVVAMMINNTTGSIIDDYKSRFASVVKITPNMERMRAEAMKNYTGGGIRISAPVIPSEQYVEFGNSAYLYAAAYKASTAANCANITAVDAHLGGQAMQGTIYAHGEALVPTFFMLSLHGNRFDDFEAGLRDLAQGRMPEGLNECIISTDLAELNGIAVGDTISLTSEITWKGSTFAETRNIDTSYELVVVGVYYDAASEYPAGVRRNAYTNRRNEILTTYETVTAPFVPDYSGITVSATYYVENPSMIAAFAEELYAKGLNPIFDVTTDEASYNKIVGPVEGLRSISLTFMLIVLAFGGAIIALLASIAIRERKYEVGVLRAMGMKKSQVALGLWSEMLIITGLCLVIGILAGTLVAQPVASALLDRQIAAAASSAQSPFPGMGGAVTMIQGGAGTGSTAQPLREISLALGVKTILQIIGVALLLASLAGLASISQITKYEPMKILMERS